MTIVGSVFVLLLFTLPNVKPYSAAGVPAENSDVECYLNLTDRMYQSMRPSLSLLILLSLFLCFLLSSTMVCLLLSCLAILLVVLVSVASELLGLFISQPFSIWRTHSVCLFNNCQK